MVRTECEYIADLECILTGYKERMSSRQSSLAQKADLIFGNMEQLLLFHKQVMLFQMENSDDNPRNIASIFIEHSEEILKIYCRYPLLLSFQLLLFTVLLQVLPKYGDCTTCSKERWWKSLCDPVLPERSWSPTSSILLPAETCPETD